MLIALLQQYQSQVVTAESCTGGAIAKALTDQAGSSTWFDQGWVAYSAHAKHKQLGVALHLLQGSMVSADVASAMALGALQRSQAQLSIAVTGIAGPGGGSARTPVGCCWFGFAFKQDLLSAMIGAADLQVMLQTSFCWPASVHSWHIVHAAKENVTQLVVCCHFKGCRHEVQAAAAALPFDLLPAIVDGISQG